MLKNFQSISFAVLSLLAVSPVFIYGQLTFYEQVFCGVFVMPLLILITQTKPSWMPIVINTLVIVCGFVLASNIIFGDLLWSNHV